MAVIGLPRHRAIEIAWFAFAAANLVAMALLPAWETIPFHFIWISLTLVYGFRVWSPGSTGLVLGLVIFTRQRGLIRPLIRDGFKTSYRDLNRREIPGE